MNIPSFIFSFAFGIAAGILSGLGGGGGTLLIIFMTVFMKIPQLQAQGINLLYFICAGLPAAYLHKKNGQINAKCALIAVIFGCISAAAASFAANKIDVSIVRTMFALLLLILGTREFFCCSKHDIFLKNIIFPPDETKDNPDNSAK